MPHYRFQIDNGVSHDPGTILSLPDLAQARLEAARLLGDVVKEEARRLLETRQLRVIVTDGCDLILFELIVAAVDSPGAAPLLTSG